MARQTFTRPPEGYSLCFTSDGTWWAMRPDGTRAPKPHTRRTFALRWCLIDSLREQGQRPSRAPLHELQAKLGPNPNPKEQEGSRHAR